MLWIIWTCCWWFVCTIGLLLDAKRYQINGESPHRAGVGFEALLLVAVWVLGMVKFWNA